MERNEITRIAREAGFVGMDGDHVALRRFAHLVAALERKACAIACEVHAATVMEPGSGTPWSACHECAAAIRARGNHANG